MQKNLSQRTAHQFIDFKPTVNMNVKESVQGRPLTYQVIKDIPLMDVDGDKSLKLGSFILGEFLSGHINQHVQHVNEVLVGGCHDLHIEENNIHIINAMSSYNDDNNRNVYKNDFL